MRAAVPEPGLRRAGGGLVELLADPGLRARTSSTGRRRVREFDWDRVVDDVIAVYDSVHMPGEKVTEDLRGQLVGRLAGRAGAAMNGWVVLGVLALSSSCSWAST